MSNQAESLQLKLALSGLANVEAGLKRIEEQVKSVGETAKHFTEVGLALAGLEGFREKFNGVLELGSQLNVLKVRIGATIPQLMAMRKLLSENGGSAEDVAILMQHMQKSLVEAAEKGGASAKVFGDIGLSVEELVSQSPGDQFQHIAVAIASIENPAKRTQAAMEIFGRSGAEVVQAFSNVKQVTEAFSKKGGFSEVMERSSEMFHEVEVNINKFSKNGTKAVAGFLDEVLPEFTDFFEQIGRIDLTEWGQKFGALAAVIINSIKENKFPEMLGLVIEAGFEIGAIAAKRILSALAEFLGSTFTGTVGKALLNAVMTFGVRVTEVVLQMIMTLVSGFAALELYAYEHLKSAFQRLGNYIREMFADVVNFFGDRIADAINLFERLMAKIKGTSPNLVSFPHTVAGKGDVDKPGTLAEDFKLAAAETHDIYDGMKAVLEEDLRLSRSILKITTGITGADGQSITALKKLNEMLEAQMKLRASMVKKEEEVKGALKGITERSQLAKLEQDEVALRQHLLDLGEKRARVDGDFALTEVQKWNIRKSILEDERATTQKIIDLYLKKAKILDGIDPARADQARKQAFGEQSKMVTLDREQSKLGANPNSFGDQFIQTAVKIHDQWGTLAKQMANTFSTVFESAVSSISKGITGLIEGTMNWRRALLEIGTTILTTIIQSIVQMGVRWVLTQLMMAIAGKAILASAQAALVPIAAAQSAIWAVPATLSTIASYGAAAASAPGFIASAEAATLGLSAFREGGYTGDGNPAAPAGVVHRREFVMPEDATRRIGLPMLNAMKNGASGNVPGSGGGAGILNVAVHDNRETHEAWISSQAGRTAVLKLVGENIHKFR